MKETLEPLANPNSGVQMSPGKYVTSFFGHEFSVGQNNL